MAGGNGGSNGGGGADAAAFQECVRKQLKEAMVARDSEDIEPLRVAVERAREAGLEPESIEAAREILTKLEAEHDPLAFTDVPRPEMERLQAATSREQAVDILMMCMSLSLDGGLQSEILAEFHYHNFMFCQKHRFCPESASTFLSIMKLLHMRAVVQEKLPEARARELFESLVKRHSGQLPPFSVGALSQEEALAAKEYASRSFFRHYSMYVYAYTQRQDLSVRTLAESVAPKVPGVTPLYKCFELDPSKVPQLQEFFADPQAEAAAEDTAEVEDAVGAANAATAAAPAGDHGSSEFVVPTTGRKAEVHAAVDEAMKAHLGALDSRLAQLPG